MSDVLSEQPSYVAQGEVLPAPALQEVAVAAPAAERGRAVDQSVVATIQYLASQGKNAAQISKAVGISYPTVRKYMAAVPAKKNGKAPARKAAAAAPKLKVKAAPTKTSTKTLSKPGRKPGGASAKTVATILPPPVPTQSASLAATSTLLAGLVVLAHEHKVQLRDLIPAIAAAEQFQAVVLKTSPKT